MYLHLTLKVASREEMAGTSSTRQVYLTYLNGTGYCFNVDDYMTIRTDHRIVGSLVGTCNTRGWSPNTNGLPAEFSCYETLLLVDKGLAQLISKDSLANQPTMNEKQLYHEIVEKRYTEQANILREAKLTESKKCMNKIMAGKRKKLIKSGINERDINITSEEILNEIANNVAFDQQNALLDIPYEHPFKYDGSFVEIAGKVSKTLKYRVFQDLWEKGMYVTSGEAFGADFLAYPGDPLVFHASHIVVILDDPTSVPTMELIAKGRLAVIVKKKCMFAYYGKVSSNNILDESIHNDNQEITYQTLHWKNCNDKMRKLQTVIK